MKIGVLFFAALLVAFSSFAQPVVSAGAKGGINLSGVVDNLGNSSSELLLGPSVGAFLNFGFGENYNGDPTLVIQPEFLYNMMGSKDADLDKTTLHYLSLPIVVQRYLGSSGIAFETGPQISYLISSKTISGGMSYDTNDSFNSIDFGILGGLIYTHSSGIGIGARYTKGFTSILKDDKIKNVSLSFTLHYIFGRGDGGY